MSPDDALPSSTLQAVDVDAAIRYLLQLTLEWETDGGRYEDGVAVLARVVAILNDHRAQRVLQRRVALLVDLVEPMTKLLKQEGEDPPFSRYLLDAVCKWLARRGIVLEPFQVVEVLRSPVRPTARDRTTRERVVDRLAQFAGTSQSNFEKLLAVIQSGAAKAGRMGNELLYERTVRDMQPGVSLLLLRALYALEIDAEMKTQILSLMPPTYIDEYIEEGTMLGELHEEGSKLAEARRRPALRPPSTDSDNARGTPGAQSNPTRSPRATKAAPTKPPKKTSAPKQSVRKAKPSNRA